jgi:hypothetical protein
LTFGGELRLNARFEKRAGFLHGHGPQQDLNLPQHHVLFHAGAAAIEMALYLQHLLTGKALIDIW